MKNALRAALLLLALLLLPGCTSAPEVPAAVLESPAPATATPELTPAATPEPTPEPTPPATPYPGEVRRGYAISTVILQQGENADFSPQETAGRDERLLQFSGLRLPQGRLYSTAWEGEGCYPYLIDLSAEDQAAVVAALERAPATPCDLSVAYPSLNLCWVSARGDVLFLDLALDTLDGREGVRCEIDYQSELQETKYFSESVYFLESEELRALVARLTERPDLPAFSRGEVERIEYVDHWYLESEPIVLREEQADLVLRIYEAGLVEPGLEKVSILGECRILLQDGRVLHGLLENGFLGLENTLMRIPDDLQDELQGILNEFQETGEALYGG